MNIIIFENIISNIYLLFSRSTDHQNCFSVGDCWVTMSCLFEMSNLRPRIILKFGHGRKIILPIPTADDQNRVFLAHTRVVENSKVFIKNWFSNFDTIYFSSYGYSACSIHSRDSKSKVLLPLTVIWPRANGWPFTIFVHLHINCGLKIRNEFFSLDHLKNFERFRSSRKFFEKIRKVEKSGQKVFTYYVKMC